MAVIGVSSLTQLSCGGAETRLAGPAASTPRSVTVALVAVGSGYQGTAVAAFADGSSREITAEAVWSSSNPAVATVSASGQVTPVAPGSTEVRAAYQAVVGGAALTVSSPPPPPAPSPIYTISGSLTDALDSRLLDDSDMCCLIELTASGRTFSASGGKYLIWGVPPGDAQITVKSNNGSYATETVQVSVSANLTRDIALRPLPMRVFGELLDSRTEARPPRCKPRIEVLDGPDAGRWTTLTSFNQFEFPEPLQPGLVTFRYSAPGGYETRVSTSRLRGDRQDNSKMIGAALACPGCPHYDSIVCP